MDNLELEGMYKPKTVKIISFVQARKLVGNGSLAFLAYIWDVSAESPSFKSVPFV